MKITKIVNKTPHPINIGEEMEIQPEGEPIRLKQEVVEKGEIEMNGRKIRITAMKYGGVMNLPEKEEGIIYIVSPLVCQALPDREDLFLVNETVRNEKGFIIGCKSLAQNPFYKGNKNEGG